jgi:polyhydroxyalkanoate synthesis regulator phasin
MGRRDAESLMSKLRQMSEEGVASFFSEVMANDRLRRTMGRAGESFFSNKQSFDRNIETVLDFVNIPSKRDVRELKARLDHVNGQLVNLSIKIDRMLAERRPESEAAVDSDEMPQARPTHKPARKAPRKK